MNEFSHRAFARCVVDIGFLFSSFSVDENPPWLQSGWVFNSVGTVLTNALERALMPIIHVHFTVVPFREGKNCRVETAATFAGRKDITLISEKPYEDKTSVLSPFFELR
jgi:hypothetical protein